MLFLLGFREAWDRSHILTGFTKGVANKRCKKFELAKGCTHSLWGLGLLKYLLTPMCPLMVQMTLMG